MPEIISNAIAKVNLTLRIYGRSSNGYHNMQSIFAFLPGICDVLYFYTDKEFSKTSANIANVSDGKNSIKKAAGILRNNFNFPVPHVVLKKRIPIESGLGGGSSDAACFVNSVFDIWSFSAEEKFKHINLFKSLGADAYVFLYKYFSNKKLIYIDGNGIDGVIESVNIPEVENAYIIVVNNGSRLSTKEVFDNYEKKINKGDIGFNNSLLQSALELEPSIRQLLEDIEKTNPIRFGLSGSGTTCFGLFLSKKSCLTAKNVLSKKYDFARISKIDS
ncbi:MAG: hypothetical protein LBU35_03410 [Holosporales bacterium]|jgi:4-diphosphocytidyl-2-C-methyl-D-erythritol kinase|nr:hypothetical protein [Holosporales bacterium]